MPNTNLQFFLQIFQLILAFGNVCVMIYTLTRFLEKPHNTLEQRITAVENELKEIKDSLQNGSGHFKDLDDTSEVILKSTLALLDTVMQISTIENHPVSEDLKEARKNLREFLAGR